jgi:hypothetical protein
LSYIDSTEKTATSDSSGNYSFTVPYNWNGQVTPSLAGYTFSPVNYDYSLTPVTSDLPNQNFTVTAITYSISGNAGLPGVTLSYTDTNPKTATSDSSGDYSLSVSYGWSGSVTPSLPGYTFTPSSLPYINVPSSLIDQNYTAAVAQMTISGNAGVPGATLTYTNSTEKTATSDSSGNYSFAVPYNWNGQVTPSLAGYTFSPANYDYSLTPISADLPNQNFTATVITYFISGNAGLPGVTLSYFDTNTKTATTDSSGDYSLSVSYRWSGTVTPSLTGYTFTPSFLTYKSMTSSLADQNYTAAVAQMTISGNAGVAGATLSYTVSTEKTATSDNSGNYSFKVPYNWNGQVTPSLAGYAFSPVNYDYSLTPVTADLPNQNFTATVITYFISGNAGLPGVTLSYFDTNTKTATTDSSGDYSLSVSYRWSGTVTPSLTGHVFSPASITYTNVLADKTNQNYALLPGAFSKTAPTNGATNQPISLKLSWAASSGATSYWYCYDTSNDNSCTNWLNNGTATTKTITGVIAGTAYYWQIKAVNSAGFAYANGSSTSFWSFKTGAPAAFTKSNPIKAATNQLLSLNLSWTASKGVTTYYYCVDKINDNKCSNWVNNSTATSKALSGLAPNTTYYWQVKAVNATGTTYANGSSTAFWSFTTGSLPGAFNKSLPVSGATNQLSTVTLKWTASSSATAYWYCYDTSNNNSCTNWVNNGKATSKIITGLSKGVTYYWQVRAVNLIGITYSNGSSTAFWSFKISSR